MDWRPAVIVFAIVAGAVTAIKPELKPAHEAVEKSQNDSYAVFCRSSEGNVSWTDPRGRTIPSSGRVHVEFKGSIGFALMFERIEVSDKGRYTCTSEKTKEITSFDLAVVTTKFVNTPIEVEVKEGNSILVRCEVEGEPKPAITWQVRGSPVDGTMDKRYLQESKGLKVLNATKSDAGIFTCKALQVSKEEGYIKTIDITLKVSHKPEWKEPVPGNVPVYGYLSGEANLSCEAVAVPEAVYTWRRRNKEVKFLKLNASEIKEPGRSVLQIQIVNESAYGEYQCTAVNRLGSVSKMFELKQGEKPDPPTGLRLVSVTVHTATLEVLGGPQELVGARVQFIITRPGQEVSWLQPEFQDMYKTENGLFEMRDLLEDTPYTVRVAARGPAGLSDYALNTITLRTRRTGEVGSSSDKPAVLSYAVVLLTALAALSTVH